jgi:uncharacterized oxidoreductase
MRVVAAESLRRLVIRTCEAIGAPPDDARTVAASLVNANLSGYDSHGVYRLGQYVDWWRKGLLHPAARPAIQHQAGGVLRVDGQLAFGQVVAAFAVQVARRAAQTAGLAVVTARRSNHVGRLADSVEALRAAGLIGLAMVNDSGAGQCVVPQGGIEGRLATNPIAVGVPGGTGPGILFDFSTSAAAAGKVRQLLLRGEAAPAGWLQDALGRQTTDPAVLFASPSGFLRPGGGHRGYALSLLVEVLAGILSGSGFANPAPGPEEMNGLFLLALDPAAFLPPDQFRAQVDQLTAYVKSARPAPGLDPVHIPGEHSHEEAARREQEGILLNDKTCAALLAVLGDLGLPADLLG